MASRGGDVLGQHRCEQLARLCIMAKARRLPGVVMVMPRELRTSPTSTKEGLLLEKSENKTSQFPHLSNREKGD